MGQQFVRRRSNSICVSLATHTTKEYQIVVELQDDAEKNGALALMFGSGGFTRSRAIELVVDTD